MLVIDRYEDESIIIAGEIKVKILRAPGHEKDPNYRVRKVRLGITAPREISVHREEIQQAIEREKAQAL